MAHTDPALALESPLLESELDQAEALVREVGWNQVAADWRIFIDLGSVYAVRNGAGRVVATAATLPYGNRFAWISMVLVTAACRRQGLARRLLDRCVRDITENGLVPILDATPAGRAVYAGMGFQDTWGFQRLACRKLRLARRVEAPSGMTIRPIADTDWPVLVAYDAEIFGADRGAVLARLRGRIPGVECAAFRDGRIIGFLLGRDGQSATQLGPLVADDEATALALVDRGGAAVEGPAYIDLADSKVLLHKWLGERGFGVQRPFTRMVFGRSESFDDPSRTFAVAGPELG
jgi:N-acetylglutamate synthase-like GNAT family acetyltransferase